MQRPASQRRKLLERLLQQKGIRLPAATVIPRRTQATPCELSFAQRRLWFLEQLEPGLPVFNVPEAYRLIGPLQVSVLERSLNEIVRRHESLRTTFAVIEGRPVQIIAPTLHVMLPVEDLQLLSPAPRESEVQRLVTEAARHPFDLTQGPLLRATLLRVASEDHILLLTVHHIVFDGWSAGVFRRELAALYAAFSSGRPSPLPELSIQYADFASWQRGWLQGEILAGQLAYWKSQLSHDLPRLALLTDRPRPALQTFRGATEAFTLSQPLAESLKALSQREGVTLFMTMLAALKVLLARYSGQEDLVVGTPIANRTRGETEALIGFLVNTLVLRTDLSGNPRLREVLGRVRRIALGAYANQDLPFETLVEELQLERDLSHTPLFQVWFVFDNTPGQAFELPGLSVHPLEVGTGAAQFDLSLSLLETERGLVGSWEYNADLFDASTIMQMGTHFHRVLEAIAADPEQRVSDVCLITDAEQRQAALQHRRFQPMHPFTEFPAAAIEQSIPDRFVEQVRRYPNRLAVKTRRYAWTYQVLERQATGIAQTIVACYGAGEGRLALCCAHDAPMLAGILGILKAGKTYVPLDPASPPARLASILADAQTRAVLTDHLTHVRAQDLIGGALPLINIDAIDASVRPDEFSSPLSPATLAYLLYTSGSTGEPKSVVQNHRNVLAHIRNYTNNLHIHADDRLTLLSAYGFDASVMDIFGALLNGATLYPIEIKDETLASLTDWLLEQEITIYHSTPSVYRYFISGLSGAEQFPRLRLVVLGGEAVYRRDVELYKKHFSPACLLINGLGPTESTVSLQFFINPQTEITRNAVPVGFPVEGTDILLLNEAGEAGAVCGEIAIRSAHLALGYWRKPELTNAAFWADPAGGGRRIYRTGDIGRFLPDGSLEFVGRRDLQVKVRGYRVELGEIETVLRRHSTVRESAVVALEDTPGETQLIAYVVSHQGMDPREDDWRRFLKATLPDYMLPSMFVRLHTLPLTPGGKVDRRSLPVPERAAARMKGVFEGPRTPVEQTVAGIWAEVLELTSAGVYDNFFDLGGHSLLATQVISRVWHAFQVDLPLRTLFEHPTVAEFARLLSDILNPLTTDTGTHPYPGGRTMRERVGPNAERTRGWSTPQIPHVVPPNTFAPFTRDQIEQSIPARFEQQVAKGPKRLAVKTRTHTLTYEGLNQAANRVADAVLAIRGCGEEPVALLLEKDAPLIAAILGVLKAGKICVMLDPSFPAARMSVILEDLQAGLTLTNHRYRALADEFVQDACQVLNIDTLEPHSSTQNPGLSISPDAPYSILYTSGSSGLPKGVVHTHRNLLHKIMLYTNSFHIGVDDRLTLLGSCSTGQGISDMFCALLNGAPLCPLNIREEGLACLAEWLVQQGITMYHSSATVFRYFVATLTGAEEFPQLRLIKLGSEPVSKKDVELYKRHFSSTCLFVNGLSSTEAGFIRYYLADKTTPMHSSIVPVGYALEDMEILLLDEDGRPVGDERVGEIAVKSPFLALGYWRRPDLTQEAFSRDPDDARNRIYRTGDLGRMHPDGCLEQLGRKDFRVKIRGHRIEVAEIELALLEHTGIKEAVVLAREEPPGDQRLVAYMVAAGPWPPTHTEIRRFLQTRLPDYMVPTAFVWVGALPRTAAGKVDRRALPEPGRTRPPLATPTVPPRTSIEGSLVRIWAEVLGLEEVGTEDDFLELGGHSLLATQIVSRVWKAFQVELPLRELLEASTVARMAQLIEKQSLVVSE